LNPTKTLDDIRRSPYDQGTYGDGALTKDGFADISNWPGYAGGKNSGV
jgi:hypothetical protein